MAALRHYGKHIAIASSVLALIFLTGFAYGKKKPPVELPPFEYVAGTEDIQPGCRGNLEVLKDSLTFTCPQHSVILPFSAISLMQYRPSLSPKVAAMKIDWKVPPKFERTKDNEYFAVIYNDKDVIHAIVLKVDPPNLRPYLAEIELKTGKSVQVYRSYEDYE
jgi:hypothetical protein